MRARVRGQHPPRHPATIEIARRAAFRAVELLPRYCVAGKGVSTELELFGRRYAAPIGVAPMGSPGLMWPGVEKCLAREAQRA